MPKLHIWRVTSAADAEPTGLVLHVRQAVSGVALSFARVVAYSIAVCLCRWCVGAIPRAIRPAGALSKHLRTRLGG